MMVARHTRPRVRSSNGFVANMAAHQHNPSPWCTSSCQGLQTTFPIFHRPRRTCPACPPSPTSCRSRAALDTENQVHHIVEHEHRYHEPLPVALIFGSMCSINYIGACLVSRPAPITGRQYISGSLSTLRDNTPPSSPGDRRPIILRSALYRVWAAIRATEMSDWTRAAGVLAPTACASAAARLGV